MYIVSWVTPKGKRQTIRYKTRSEAEAVYFDASGVFSAVSNVKMFYEENLTAGSISIKKLEVIK